MKHATRICGLSVSLVALGVSSASMADQVTITGLNWDAAKVITQIVSQIGTERLDVPVQVVEGITKDALVSMDAGDGAYDIFPDIWMPNQQAAWETYVEERQSIRHNDGYPAEQGFYLLRTTAETLGLSDISDLGSAEIAAQFDSDGDGLGEYWAGEETWRATELNQIKMSSYGLSEYWEPWIASNEDLKVALEEASESERPILFYHWSPEWVFGAYEIDRLNEPAYEEGCKETFSSSERDDWLTASKFNCAFETSQVYLFYSATLEERFPEMASMLSRIAFTPEMINGWVLETGVNGKSPESVAAEWIAANPDTVSGWVSSTVMQ